MSEIRKRLLDLNPDLFGSPQAPVENEVILVGRIIGSTTIFLLKSEPNSIAQKAKIPIGNFLHLVTKPTGTITVNADGSETYGGPKKGRAYNVFQTAAPETYNFIRRSVFDEVKDVNTGKTNWVLKAKNDTNPELSPWLPGGTMSVGNDNKECPIIILRNKLFGRKVVFNYDLYTPHFYNTEGLPEPLKAKTKMPKTGTYEMQNVVMGSFEFFADPDDLGNLLEVCAKYVQKNIEPWLTGSQTITNKVGSTVTTTIKEAALTGMEDFIIDEYLNAVDDTMDVIASKKQLEASGIDVTTIKEGDMIKLDRASFKKVV
jgi:hypothetical protein